MSSDEKKGTGAKHPIAIQKARVEKLMKNPVWMLRVVCYSFYLSDNEVTLQSMYDSR